MNAAYDIFNWSRHTFLIPHADLDRSFGQTSIPQWGMLLLYSAAFFAFVSGVWIWLYLPTVLAAAIPVAGLAGMGCAVSGLRVLGSDTDTKVLGRLDSFDASFFMPYSVCPGCGVEALHWLADAHIDLADDAALLDFFERVCKHNGMNPADYQQHARLFHARLWAKNRTSDVIRECRDCGHTWGQRAGGLVMPTEEIAEADAPTLRATKANDAWITFNEDKW